MKKSIRLITIGLLSFVTLSFSPSVINENHYVISANKKHVKKYVKHHIRHNKKSIHHKKHKLPNGELKYSSMDEWGFKFNPIATKDAIDTINIPQGYPFYFKDGQMQMESNFSDKFTKESYKINNFNPNVNDMKKKVDINNITRPQQDEMTKYAADLINGVRHNLSNNVIYTADLTPDDRIMDMTNDIIVKYNNDKWELMKYNGHDVKAINEVAQKYGFLYSTDYSTSDDQQYYEDMSTSALNGRVSMANVKQNIFEAICAMLFDDKDSQWMHAENLISSDEQGETSEKFGVGIDKMGQIHFETVPNSYEHPYSYDNSDN